MPAHDYICRPLPAPFPLQLRSPQLGGHLPSSPILWHVAGVVDNMSSADGAVIPATPPPLGVTPNFENPEWIGYRLIIVSAVFPVLSLCFLIPRLYSAAFIIRKWHNDDCKAMPQDLVESDLANFGRQS